MRKKKVLFIAPNLHHGGAEAVLIKLINNINLNLFEIKLILFKKQGDHLSKIDKSIEVIDLKSSNTLFSIPKLVRIIRKEKPEYIFSIIGHINIIMAFIKIIFFNDIKFIGRENVVYSEWLYKELTLKKLILNVLYKKLLKKLDVVVVQSNFMAEEIIRYFKVNEKKVIIINNPIENDKIHRLSCETGLSNWNKSKKNLIAVGRIESVKNYKDMIDILELLPENYHLNILGDGKDKEKLLTYISNKEMDNRITLHGYVENPYKFIKASELLLLTSHRESSPNVVIEANACGIYTVSYDMPGGIREMISHNINGSLIPVGDKALFAKEILLKTKKLDNEDLKIYSEKFSIENFMKKIYTVI
ncbi:glycosyltransferase [Metaplanococcus flavidus]